MAKDIRVTLTLDTKQFDKKMAGAKTSMNGFSNNSKKASGSLLAMAARFVPVVAGAVALAKSFAEVSKAINISSQFEDIQVTLKNVTGSAEAGAAAFELIKRTAEEIPFAFDELAASAPALATVSKNAGELQDNMMLAADIAATTGMSFTDAASQLQRSFSAGAGAADMFREKGVLAMAGFEAGVKYSIDETIAKFKEFGETIEGAAQDLSQTFTGSVSQAGDRLTLFRAAMGDAIVPELTSFLNILVTEFDKNKEAVMGFATTIGTNVVNSIIFALRYLATMADIVLSVGRVATRVGKAFKENFGEQINTVVSIVIKSIAALVQGLGYVGLAVGKVISMISGEESVENFFENIVDGANKVRTEGLDAVGEVRDGLGDMIPVTTVRDRIDTLVANMKDGAQEIRDTTTSMVDKTEADLRKFEFNIGNTATNISDSFTNISNVLRSLSLFDEFTKITIPLNMMIDKGGNPIFKELVFRNLIEFREELKRVEDELKEAGLEFKDFNEEAIILELVKGKMDLLLITAKDYTTIQKIINDLYEEGNITLGEQLDLLAQLDETFADQEGLRSFIETIGTAQKTLSEDLATALLEGESAGESFKKFFKTLVTQLIADALRLAIIQPILSSIFGIEFGAGGVVSGLTGGGLLGFITGKANGGPVMRNRPYLVGEKGPELMIPNASGNIVPNNMLGGGGVTNVYYRIEATDPQSFQAQLARNPEFVYSVTRAGQRKLPGR